MENLKDFWEIDGNFWSKDKFAYETAQDLAKTLSNCKGCVDCEWCRDCYNCIECDDCKNCYFCQKCRHCDNFSFFAKCG